MFDTFISDEDQKLSLQNQGQTVNQHDVKAARKKGQSALHPEEVGRNSGEPGEAIETFMLAMERTEIHTEKFIISLVTKADISLRTSIDLNQLTLNFTNPKEKEERPHESIDPQKTILEALDLGQDAVSKHTALRSLKT